jgi:hypothetical protein
MHDPVPSGPGADSYTLPRLDPVPRAIVPKAPSQAPDGVGAIRRDPQQPPLWVSALLPYSTEGGEHQAGITLAVTPPPPEHSRTIPFETRHFRMWCCRA